MSEETKITLVKNDELDDWYTIEKSNHEHKVWFEELDGGLNFMHSGRISDACVEGNGKEMLAIADAIRSRKSVCFRRCAVRIDGDSAYFWSPRNSTREAKIPIENADEFARQCAEVLRKGE